MPTTKRAVFLKQSGELLDDSKSRDHWQAAAQVAAKLADAYKKLDQLNVSGLSIITGAGNIARGDSLRAAGLADRYADAIGRWGTIGNSIVLADALEALQVSVELLITDKMAYQDYRLQFSPYSAKAVQKAHQVGKIVIIAGGTGLDNVTTDNAVAFYANDYSTIFDGQIIVLKSTKFDGVYVSDPAQSPRLPAKYSKISAKTIRDNYQQFKVVDKSSLDQLIDGQLQMLVYSDAKHSFSDVLSAQNSVGTLIVPEDCEPELAA